VESLGGSVSQEYAPEDVLTGGYLIDKPNKAVTLAVMDSLNPRRMNVAFVDPKFDEADAKEKEHYYQVAYKKEPLSEELMARLEKADDKTMSPAPKLRYVPTNLELVKKGSGEAPKQLLEKGRVNVWWQGMNKVQLPKGDVQLKLGFPQQITKSIEGGLLAGIHSRIVNQLLEGPTDELQMCGVSYGIGSYDDGWQVSFSGFDQHLESMMKIVLPVVREPEFSDEQFESVRRQTLLDLQDISKQEPYHHAMEAFDVVSVKGQFARSELVQAVQDTTKLNPEAYRAFLAKLYKEMELTMLFSGNIAEERATSMALIAEEQLKVTRDQEKVSLTRSSSVLKPDSTVEIRIPNPIVGDPNSATLAAYQVGIPTIQDRVTLQLLGDIIGDPVFDTLRTKHQLGYVVFGYTTLHKSVAEVRVLVQGFRKNPDQVEPLVESTVSNITQILKSMSRDEFVQRKKNVKLLLTKPEKTLGQEVSKSWNPIWSKHTHCFDKKQKMIAKLDEMGDSTEPLVQMWEKAVKPSEERKKIIVKLFGGVTDAKAMPKEEVVAGLEVVTLIDSQDLKDELKDANYWPGDKLICE